jgi:hypothetical protein
VTYRIAVDWAAGPFEVEVTLVYQSVPPEVVDSLASHEGRESRRFGELCHTASPVPETVQRCRLEL